MKEGDVVTSENLRTEWKHVLSIFDTFIDNGYKLRPLRLIVRHIIQKGYNKALLPGTSMYSLLISIPIENRVSHNKTLSIGLDELRGRLEFKFSDWTGIDRHHSDAKKQIKWAETCLATEGSTLIEHFFADNEDFRKAIAQK